MKDFSTDPSYSNDIITEESTGMVDTLTSAGLSRRARFLFEKAEKTEVDELDIAKINGSMSYDNGATISWVYECVSRLCFYSDEGLADILSKILPPIGLYLQTRFTT